MLNLAEAEREMTHNFPRNRGHLNALLSSIGPFEERNMGSGDFSAFSKKESISHSDIN